MTTEKDIGWMYEGVKSSVNREDYLLGKRVDKNFEKYSDAVVKQKDEHLEAVVKSRTTETGTAKTSSIPLEVMRTEDPLVALRVKEESRRRDMLENPLTKLKFQKFLKKAMEKREKKAKKSKKKKRTRSCSSSPSDASDDSSIMRRKSGLKSKSKRSRSHDKKDHTSDKKERRRDSSERKKGKEGRKRSDSSSQNENNMKKKQRHSDRYFDSHIPPHLQSKVAASDSEDERREHRASTSSKYGLVHLKERPKDGVGKETLSENPYRLARLPKTAPPSRSEGNEGPRRPLTAEEKERRLRDMQENALWREETRSERLKREAMAGREEEAVGRPANFIRPMLNEAAQSLSMQQRLLSKKKNLQSVHDIDKFISR